MILTKQNEAPKKPDTSGPVHTMRTGEAVWLPSSAEEVAFWNQLCAVFNDESTSASDLFNLMYSASNPLLDPAPNGDGVVLTREVYKTSLWSASSDLLARKEVSQAEATARRDEETAYSLSVREAAEMLGISPRAVRTACKKGTLVAILPSPEKGYMISHSSVAHYRSKHKPRGRGASSKTTTADLQVRAGNKQGVAFWVGIQNGEKVVSSDNLEGANGWEGSIKNWERVGVEMRLKKEGKGSSRFFLLAPKQGASEAVEFEGFFVRGAFEIVEKINNSNKARARMASFHKGD